MILMRWRLILSRKSVVTLKANTELTRFTKAASKSIPPSMSICSALQIDIEGGIDFEAAFVNLVSSVFAFKVTTDFLDKIRRQRIRIMRETEDESSRAPVGSLAGGTLTAYE